MKTNLILKISLALLLVFLTNFVWAHCDTMDGPVVADARKAIEQKNVK